MDIAQLNRLKSSWNVKLQILISFIVNRRHKEIMIHNHYYNTHIRIESYFHHNLLTQAYCVS